MKTRMTEPRDPFGIVCGDSKIFTYFDGICVMCPKNSILAAWPVKRADARVNPLDTYLSNSI
jgi:hypothetical protein